MRRWVPLVALLLALVGSPAVAQDDFVDMETCGGCHPDVVEAFAAGAHGKAMARWSEDLLARSCVGCHGPGEEHIEDPLPENIMRMPAPDACGSCHKGKSGQLFLATPGHVRHGVGCLDCHASGHEATPAEPLLAAKPYDLCSSCHRLQGSAAYRPFAHRDGNEPFACTECHSPHATGRTGRLSLAGSTEVCLDCHTEKAGPFVFPHPTRDVEGCVACHQPHGSTNPRLLKRRTVMNLCLECHPGIPALHDLSQARFRACQSCHVAVHGSNRDARLFDE